MIDMTSSHAITSEKKAPGLYKAGPYWIEYIDAQHECAEVVDVVPCWRVDDDFDVFGEFPTKREALAAIETTLVVGS